MAPRWSSGFRGPAEAAPGARGKCGRPGTWISREASRARAGYGAGGLRGRRWWQGPVHGGLSAESPSGAVRLVTQKEICDLSGDQKPTSCLKAQVAVCHGKPGAANGEAQ